jgi:hypothetical protein
MNRVFRTFGTFCFDDGLSYGVEGVDDSLTAELDLLSEEMARRPGAKLLGSRYRSRRLSIRGWVVGDTPDALQEKWQALELAFSREAQNLKTFLAGDARHYVAGPAVIRGPVNSGARPCLAQYEAEFLLADPFAVADTASQDSQPNKLLSLVVAGEYRYVWTIAPGGTAPSQPKFTITIPAGGPYGMTKLWIINDSLSPPLKLVVIKAFAANDVIVIDSALFDATVNAVAAANTEGAYPSLDPRTASNALEVHALATSAPTLSITTDWTPRYLS